MFAAAGPMHSIRVKKRKRKGKELNCSPGNGFQERNDQSHVQCWTAILKLCYLHIYLCLMRFSLSRTPYFSMCYRVEQIMAWSLIFCPVIRWCSTGTVPIPLCSANFYLFLVSQRSYIFVPCWVPIIFDGTLTNDLLDTGLWQIWHMKEKISVREVEANTVPFKAS